MKMALKEKLCHNLANKIFIVLTGDMLGYRRVILCAELVVKNDIMGEWKQLYR
jgi:hypothetical protein